MRREDRNWHRSRPRQIIAIRSVGPVVGFDTESTERIEVAEKHYTGRRESLTGRITGLGIKVGRLNG